MTGDDHTSETPGEALQSTGGAHGPQRLDDASPQGDDAGPRQRPRRQRRRQRALRPGRLRQVRRARLRRRALRPSAPAGHRSGLPRRAALTRQAVLEAEGPTSPDAGRAGGAGKAARAEVPRSIHGEWGPPSSRRDPVDLL